jgi:hypothetical protein
MALPVLILLRPRPIRDWFLGVGIDCVDVTAWLILFLQTADLVEHGPTITPPLKLGTIKPNSQVIGACQIKSEAVRFG